MRKGYADLHHHILWGLDDGPRTAENMQAMLRLAAENGVGLIAATSHACPALRPFDRDLYVKRLEEANRYCAEQSLPLSVVSGCEILYTDSVPDLLAAGKLPTLGDSRYVLVEFLPDVSWETIDRASNRISRVGYHTIVAHVERYRCFLTSPRRAIRLKNVFGLLYQMNGDTILHPHGWREKWFVHRMLQEKAIDLVASDAHNTASRRVCMQEAEQVLLRKAGTDYARKLLHFGWEIAGIQLK